MKKVILGSVMFFAGLLSVVVILAETMSKDEIVNGQQLSSFRIMSQYGLMPVFCILVGIAILGIGIAIWGVLEKKE